MDLAFRVQSRLAAACAPTFFCSSWVSSSTVWVDQRSTAPWNDVRASCGISMSGW